MSLYKRRGGAYEQTEHVYERTEHVYEQEERVYTDTEQVHGAAGTSMQESVPGLQNEQKGSQCDKQAANDDFGCYRFSEDQEGQCHGDDDAEFVNGNDFGRVTELEGFVEE